MNHPSPWTPEKVELLRALWAEGLSASKIGQRLGISKNSIVSKVHRIGLPGRPSPIASDSPTRAGCDGKPRKPRVLRAPKTTLEPLSSVALWTAEEDKRLEDLRRQGKSYTEIAALMERSASAIANRALRLGVNVIFEEPKPMIIAAPTQIQMPLPKVVEPRGAETGCQWFPMSKAPWVPCGKPVYRKRMLVSENVTALVPTAWCTAHFHRVYPRQVLAEAAD